MEKNQEEIEEKKLKNQDEEIKELKKANILHEKTSNQKEQEIELLKKQIKTIQIGRIKDGFSDDTMREGMMDLRYFKEKNKPDFLMTFVNLWNDNYSEFKKISLASGRFFHLLKDNIFNIFDEIDDAFIKQVVHIEYVTFLLEIVDPLEKVKAELLNTEYDENIAKECRRIFKDELEK